MSKKAEVLNERFPVDDEMRETKVVTPKTSEVTPTKFAKPQEWHHLIKVDEEGKDILGTDFAVSVETYRRSFEVLTLGSQKKYRMVEEGKKKH